MEFEKELALALDFANAPKELQTIAQLHFANLKAVAKIKATVDAANAQLAEAERVFAESAKAFRISLKNWTPNLDNVIKEIR